MDENQHTAILNQLNEAIHETDIGRAVVRYDGDADILIVHLYGLGRRAVNVVVADDFMVRLDRDHDQVVGIQVDHFLSKVVPEHPNLLDILDIAQLLDISSEQVMSIRREYARKRRASVAGQFGHLIEELGTIASAAD
jgi:hypothetical protein